MNLRPVPLMGRALALAIALLAILLVLGGLQLARAGGSLWYVTTGCVLVASAVLLWRRNRWGLRLYGLVLAYTLAWSLWESGFNAWALLPRMGLLVMLGAWFGLPVARRDWSRRDLPWLQRARLRGVARGGTLLLVIAVCGCVAWVLVPGAAAGVVGGAGIRPGPAPAAAPPAALAPGDWQNYGNDTSGTRYSPLAQVAVGNVASLAPAWQFRTGEHGEPGEEYNFEVTPLKVGRLLYACTPRGQVIALDAASGAERWRFDARGDYRGVNTFICRGVSYYDSHARQATCSARIYVATPDNRLWALDARDGRPCQGFGSGGAVDLRAGLGDVPPGSYGVTSPPVVSRGRLVVGARVADNVSIDMPSGVVRAFDAMSGELAWAWDIGRPDRTAAPAPGETYTRSTPNAWAPLVADDALGLVYLPTGNPAADYYGGHRRSFDHEYGASLVAVDIETGRARWHFQATHHDIWDNDLSAQPVLVDLPSVQGMRHAVIFGSKQGNLFVLDRVTGEAIVPVAEQPAPQPSRIGEALSPTQPVSALAVNPGPARLTEAHMWGLTPLDQMWCRIQFRRARYEGPYTPPGTDQPTIAYPGMFGGIEWSGISVDPVRRILVANPNAMPFIVRMAEVRATATVPAGMAPMRGTGFAVSYYGFLSPLKIPCLQPPWGELEAIDLDTRHELWRRPVGTTRDTGPLGIASRLSLRVGTPQVGGSIITAGGLVFTGATLDQYLRAYELATGRELWRARLPAGGQATPMTYEIDGRQYVVIAAGGHSVLGTKAGDYLMAYALPGAARATH